MPPPTNPADDCYRCGYDLRGIGDEQPCPECGLLARRSRRESDQLHDTRPRWLRRISRGANLMLLAVMITIAWPVVWGGFYGELKAMLGPLVGPSLLLGVLPYVGLYVAAVLLAVGIWLLTAPEGYPPADHADRPVRHLLRALSVVPVLALALYTLQLNRALFRTYRSGWNLLEWTTWLLSTLAVAPLPVLVFMQLRTLAGRVRSAHLAEHCLIVGIGTSLACVYAAVLSLMMEHAEKLGLGSNWVSGSDVALGMTVVMAVASLLFALWSLYLLALFAIAFHRGTRQLRGKWSSDDRSAAGTGA